MQDNLSPMRRAAVLEQINPLPCPQSKLATKNRNRKLHAGQNGADVGGHVVSAFVGVPVSAVLRRRAVEKCLEICADVSRGVLLNDQPGRVCRQNKVKSPA
jgi:hypothetical protein